MKLKQNATKWVGLIILLIGSAQPTNALITVGTDINMGCGVQYTGKSYSIIIDTYSVDDTILQPGDMMTATIDITSNSLNLDDVYFLYGYPSIDYMGNRTQASIGANTVVWNVDSISPWTYDTKACVNDTCGTTVCTTGTIPVMIYPHATTTTPVISVGVDNVYNSTTAGIPNRPCFTYLMDMNLLKACLCPFENAFGGG